MPYINVKITEDPITPEQKEAVIAGITDVMVRVLGKNPETTFVVIDQVPTDNWGIGGTTTTKRRAQQAQPTKA
jgi:4-oxalocrotonate tautomerase